MQENKSQEMLDAMHTLRCIVLMECEAGHFHQIMLNQEQYKAMNAVISAPVTDPGKTGRLKPGYEIRGMHMKHGWKLPADTLIGLQDMYTRKEIADEAEKTIHEDGD